jgi:hypothetical protein
MTKALLLISMTLWTPLSQSQDESKDERMIQSLILKLGSDQIEERREAERELIALGEKAEPALRKALASKDAEIVTRAKSALDALARVHEEKDWEERVKALPKTCGTRKIRNGELEVALNTFLRGGELVFEDDATLALNGEKKPFVTIKTVCAADPTFLLREFSYELTDPTTGKKLSYVGKVKDGKLVVTGDRSLARKVSMKTIGNLTFYRLLWTLPQRAGFAVECDVYDERLGFYPGQKVIGVGEEEVEIDGKNLKAWKWEFARRIPDSKEVLLEYYWVANGKLVKASSAYRFLEYPIEEFAEVFNASTPPRPASLPFVSEHFMSRLLAAAGSRQVWGIDPDEIQWASQNMNTIIDHDLKLSVNPGGGLKIDALSAGTIVATRGLLVGDIVKDIDGQPINSIADARKALSSPGMQKFNGLQLTLERGGKTVVMEYRPLPK